MIDYIIAFFTFLSVVFSILATKKFIEVSRIIRLKEREYERTRNNSEM